MGQFVRVKPNIVSTLNNNIYCVSNIFFINQDL